MGIKKKYLGDGGTLPDSIFYLARAIKPPNNKEGAAYPPPLLNYYFLVACRCFTDLFERFSTKWREKNNPRRIIDLVYFLLLLRAYTQHVRVPKLYHV